MVQGRIGEGREARGWGAAAGLAGVLLGAALAGPAAALDFEVGEVRGRLDTTVSIGASMRVEDRDCDLIFAGNGGCNPNIAYTNADDGNLNYDKWDVFSNAYKATVDLELDWRNLGAFFRGSVFYDLVTMETHTARTDLDRDALYRSSLLNSGVVGMGYQLLDAYVWGDFEVAGRPVNLRLGNQVLAWGETIFYAGGVSSINTVDLARLRTPGSELKEAFLPAPIVRLSTELVRNLGLEVFYQAYWNRTQLDPVGSYFSTNDLIGRAAEGFFLGPDPGARGLDAEDVFEQTFPAPPSVVTPIQAEDIPPELIPPPFTPELLAFILAGARNEGFDPSTLSVIPAFFPVGIPRLRDETPSSQGQWGAALRYFAEAIRTEFGVYYLRIHDKQPSVGFAAEPFDLAVDTFLIPESFPPQLLPFFPPAFLPPNAINTTVEPVSVPTGYFREYPEDIDVYGASVSTEVFGVALGGELSYRTRQPTPITSAFEEALARAQETRRRVRVSGFVREKRLQAQLNAIAVIGPGDPVVGALVRWLRLSTINIAAEAALVRYPDLDDDVLYAGPDFSNDVDETSWGYTILVQGDYDNPLGIPVTVTPRVSFAHDVDGNTPGLTPFIEHRKALNLGVTVDYLQTWQVDVGYTNFFGAGVRNNMNDRDFVSFSVTHSF